LSAGDSHANTNGNTDGNANGNANGNPDDDATPTHSYAEADSYATAAPNTASSAESMRVVQE